MVGSEVSKPIVTASQILVDYEYWLKRKYCVTGAYLVNAKSFLKTYKPGGDVLSQLTDYVQQKNTSLRSILKRFYSFLELKKIQFLINDLNEPKLPISNIYVKLFLASVQDRLRSKGSVSIYATVLNGYFSSIKDDITRINKRTAAKYILSPSLSDFTKRLYKAVLKSFCEWVLEYQGFETSDLSKDQRQIKAALKKISTQSLKEVASLRVVLPRSLTSTYHKDSLTEQQRDRLLRVAKIKRDRAILSLMAWNGLRSIEVLRLSVPDIKFSQGRITIWGKGRSEKSKDTIKMSSTVKKEVGRYLKSEKIKKGKVFPNLDRARLDELVMMYFRKLRLKGRYTPHSLRHTAGQIMYDKGVLLEFIQKTLRHADLRSTMIYTQKSVDKNYLKKMRRF